MDRLISEQVLIDTIKTWAVPLQISNFEAVQDIWVEEVCRLIKAIPSAEPKVGRCENCKCFHKLSLSTDTSIGKCIKHWGVCPPCDWYCADFELQESEEV